MNHSIGKPPTKAISRGTWTANEHSLFLKGCIKYGWGRWMEITATIPTRTNRQVKSHAQKFAAHHPKQKRELLLQHEAEANRALEGQLATAEASSVNPILDVQTETVKEIQECNTPNNKYDEQNDTQSTLWNAMSTVDDANKTPSNQARTSTSPQVKDIIESIIPSKKEPTKQATYITQQVKDQETLTEARDIEPPPPRKAYLRRVSDDLVDRQEMSTANNSIICPISPSKVDVICALGEAYSIHHCGNRRFQVVIEMYLEKFQATESYDMKELLVNEVLHTIKLSGGRFLLRRENGQWKVASDAFARKKIETSFVSFMEARSFS